MTNLNIRQKINLADRSPKMVVLENEGIVSDNGHVTALGRRIQGDLIASGKGATFDDLFEAVLSVKRAEKAVEAALNVEDDTEEPQE